jgi:hypothetical protein
MTIDLTSGLDESREFLLTDKPADPQLRESVSMWISDDQGVIGLPRVGIEAIGESWETRDFQVNLAFPDGRAVIVREAGDGLSPADSDGVSRALRAGGLEFRCVEPFVKWTLSYEGKGLDTTASALARGDSSDARPVDLQIHVETTMAAPPWVPGSLVDQAEEMMNKGIEGRFISDRYEQLCRAQGAVRIGNEETSFTGTGLRIRRQGVRNVEGFWGHCWQSALFPNGRGFGFLAFPPRPDGEDSFNEGYVFDGEQLVAAQVVDAPWMTRLQPSGEDVSLVLRTANGDVRIEGETVLSTFLAGGTNHDFAPALQQAGACYRWDGDETYGMIERSTPVDKLAS